MRFWNRKERVTMGSGRVKATQTSQRPHRQFNVPEIGQRRSFSSWLDQPDESSAPAPVQSMNLPEADPTDPTRGGVDQVMSETSRIGLPPYTITNLTSNRAYDANSTNTTELADVLGTLIKDLNKVLKEIDGRLRHA